MSGAARGCLALAVAALAWPAASRAQTWTMEAQAGRLRYDVGATATASSSLGLGVRYSDPRSWARLTVGVPLEAGEAVWLGAGTWQRLSLARGLFSAGIDLTGHALGFRQRNRSAGGLLDDITETTATGTALAGEALPFVALSRGPLRLEARAGASHYYTETAGEGSGRTVWLGDGRVELTPASNVLLGGSVRRVAAEEGDYTYTGGGLTLLTGPAQLWASAGKWLGRDADAVPWAAGAIVHLHERAGVSISARRDGLDPIYRLPPRTTWSVGVHYRLAGPPRPAEPVPASYVDGIARIVVRATDAPGQPSVAGDFNDWTPAPMERAGQEWTYDVRLEPGVYKYAFVAQDGTWFVPASVPGRTDDGMGGHVAVLVVR